jgi:hypothetical protein
MDNTNLQTNIPSQKPTPISPQTPSLPPRHNTPRIIAIFLIIIFIILAGFSVWVGVVQKTNIAKIKPVAVSIYTRPDSLTIAQAKSMLPPGLPIDPRAWNFYATSTVHSGITDYTVSFMVPQSNNDAFTVYSNYTKLLNWKPVVIPGLKNTANAISVGDGTSKMVILFVPLTSGSLGHEYIATSTSYTASSTAVVATSTVGHTVSAQLTMVMIMYEK